MAQPPRPISIPLPPMPGAFPDPPSLNRLPAVPITAPGADWVIDFEDNKAYQKAKVAGKYTQKLTDDWLKSEKYWKYRIGKSWTGEKIMGKGGQGIVGHWTYEGADRDQKTVKDIAVKQALRSGPAYRWGDGLESEAVWLAKFANSKSPHIVRMYKHIYEEKGQKTIDLDWGVVQRIYLEFCPGGDLANWLAKYILNPRYIPENELWCIFQCLARGALVMHHGSEDTSSPRYMTDGEVVHFDIKHGNILIGEDTLDLEHRNRPPIKFTDFGLARKVPMGSQDASYRKQYEYFGTHPFYTPEQVNSKLFHSYGNRRPWVTFITNHVPNARYGTCTNIWHIGLVMQCLMRRKSEPDWPDYEIYQSNGTPRLTKGGNTVGSRQDAKEDSTGSPTYSQALRHLVAECLLLAPANRIPVRELVKRTGDAVGAAQMAQGTILTNPPLAQWAEPVVSAQWYSGQDPPNANVATFQAAKAKAIADQAKAEADRKQRLKDIAAATAKINSTRVATGQQAAPASPAARVIAARPITRLRVIVQTKPNRWGLGGGHKPYTLDKVTADTTVVEVKDILEKNGCGIKATGMNLMFGRTLMLNHQTLGEFPGLDVARAMDA